jgi:RimJ/RimL family protein N-acetyltransferase
VTWEFAQQAPIWGCRELRAITSPVNTSSIAFHERLGFATTTVADYNGPDRPMAVFHARSTRSPTRQAAPAWMSGDRSATERGSSCRA